MVTREKLLLLLTGVGFLVPNAMVVVFLAEHGVDVGRYAGNVVATLPAAQFTADLTISFGAFALWTAWDGPRIGVRRWWVTIPAICSLDSVSRSRSTCCYARRRFPPARAESQRLLFQAEACGTKGGRRG
jgi:hypothetical protein